LSVRCQRKLTLTVGKKEGGIEPPWGVSTTAMAQLAIASRITSFVMR
jgi:hypothetical protein